MDWVSALVAFGPWTVLVSRILPYGRSIKGRNQQPCGWLLVVSFPPWFFFDFYGHYKSQSRKPGRFSATAPCEASSRAKTSRYDTEAERRPVKPHLAPQKARVGGGKGLRVVVGLAGEVYVFFFLNVGVQVTKESKFVVFVVFAFKWISNSIR